jgi:hypothetical protein
MTIGSLCVFKYHISKRSLSEPQTVTSNAAMDDLETALLSLEVKLDGDSNTANDMLVRHLGELLAEV